MTKKFRVISWVIGLILVFVFAHLFGQIITALGISNRLLIAVIGSVTGVFCRELYHKTIKYITSEEHRLNISFVKNKLEKNIKREQEAMKRKTIVDLYLLNEKKSLVKIKKLCVVTIFVGVLVGYFLDFGHFVIFVGAAIFALTEIKERILTYRISKGFFGNNSTEAIQLLKFIEANIDKIDDGTGGKRKILNEPVIEESSTKHVGQGVCDAQ